MHYIYVRIKDVWSVRILVQNGMVMYASWCFVMFLITLNLSLVYEYKISKEISHIIIIGIILVKMIAYFLIENYLAYAYCKFLFTAWIVYALFLIDTLVNQLFVKHKLQIDDQFRDYNHDPIDNSLKYSKLNISFLFHTGVISAWFFLLIAKLTKFIWSECCRQKRFSL